MEGNIGSFSLVHLVLMGNFGAGGKYAREINIFSKCEVPIQENIMSSKWNVRQSAKISCPVLSLDNKGVSVE